MSSHIMHGDDFTALTVTDTAGAILTVERTDAGDLSAWIAPPGGNDGHSVRLDEADAISLAAYVSAGGRSWLVPVEPDVEKVRDRHGRVWVRSTYEKAPNQWWRGERGASIPHTWHEMLADYGPLTEVKEAEAVTGR